MIKRNNAQIYFKIPNSLKNIKRRKNYESTLYSEIYGVKNLIWNKRENRAVEHVLKSLAFVLKELKLSPMTIDHHHIHILSKKEYFRHFRKESTGKFEFGHIYIPRSTGKCHFLISLAHELAHLASFYGLQINITYNNQLKRFQDEIILRYCGLNFSNQANTKDYFLGVNEAVAEIFSNLILLTYSQKHPLTPEDKKYLSEPQSYIAHILILRKIFEKNFSSQRNRRFIFQQLLKNYITGKHTVLKKLPKNIQNILSEMKPADESAYETAKKLKFYKLAKEIKTKYLPQHKPKSKLPH